MVSMRMYDKPAMKAPPDVKRTKQRCGSSWNRLGLLRAAFGRAVYALSTVSGDSAGFLEV
eukprot:1751642-Karenia_brevis.AAC.1